MVESRLPKPLVAGSIPVSRSIFSTTYKDSRFGGTLWRHTFVPTFLTPADHEAVTLGAFCRDCERDR